MSDAEDKQEAMKALRKISNLSPMSVPGGPNNRYIGLKSAKMLAEAKTIAIQTLHNIAQREAENERK